jgi:hypothetical protein
MFFLVLSFLLLPFSAHAMRNCTDYKSDSEIYSLKKRIKNDSDSLSPAFGPPKAKRTTIGDLTFGELDKFLDDDTRVCRADLSGLGFTSCRGIGQIFAAKEIDPGYVVRLDLSDNELRIDRPLLDFLPKASCLMTLSLSNNNITYIPAQFVTILNRLPLLQYVCLDRNPLSIKSRTVFYCATLQVQLALARGELYTLTEYLALHNQKK